MCNSVIESSSVMLGASEVTIEMWYKNNAKANFSQK